MDETQFTLFTFPREKWDQLSSLMSHIIQDGGLHVCKFDIKGLSVWSEFLL